MPAERTKDPGRGEHGQEDHPVAQAVFFVIFEVFGTMIMFLAIIGLIALLGWLLASQV